MQTLRKLARPEKGLHEEGFAQIAMSWFDMDGTIAFISMARAARDRCRSRSPQGGRP